MIKENGGSAFPVAYSHEGLGNPIQPQAGMALRDYFAAKAMQGMHSSDAKDWTTNESYEAYLRRARLAYWQADAMLEARKS